MLSSRPAQLTTNASYFPTKTPGRGLKNRVENAIHPGAKTVQGLGKNLGTPLQPSTIQPQRLFKESTATKTQLKPIVLATRPLADKTPFVNRARTYFSTPLGKGGKLSLQEDDGVGSGTPDSLQRPSSMRKHVRAPRSATKSFETPVNQGRHWDISDGDIVVPELQPQETIVEDEDLDEIEFMPPNTLDLPYKPPFDFELPDYKVVGQTLRSLAYSVPYDPVTFDLEILETNLEPASCELPCLDFIHEDDPFSQPGPPKPVTAKSVPSKVAARPVPVPKPVYTRTPSVASTTVAGPPLSRTATSTSTRTTTASKFGPSRTTTKLADAVIRTTPVVITRPSVRPAATRNNLPSTTAAAASRPMLKRPLTATATYKSTTSGTARSAGRAGVPSMKSTLESALILKPTATGLDGDDFMFDV